MIQLLKHFPVDPNDVVSGSTDSAKRAETQNGKLVHGRRTQLLLTSIPLAVSDLLALVGANLLAFVVILLVSDNSQIALATTLPLLFLLFVIVNMLVGLYPGTGLNPVFELRQTTIASVLLYAPFVASALSHNDVPLSILLGVASLFTMLFAPLLRSIVRARFSRFRWWGQPTLIVGKNHSAQRYFELLSSNPYLGFKPVAIVDDHQQFVANKTDKDFPDKGIDRSTPVKPIHDVFCTVIAMPNWHGSEILDGCDGCLSQVVTVNENNELPSVGNRLCNWAAFDGFSVKERPLIKSRTIKRAIDIVMVLISGLLIIPLVSVIAFLIKIGSTGPVFYSQERIGRRGRPFRAWKFRTMVANADEVLQRYLATDPQLLQEWEENHKLKNDPRVTGIGRLLRKTSLDELPQLWNVLIGEMTLVGPRPIVNAEISKYGKCFSLYTKVVPGLTGLWQISGRNNTTYDERVRLDNYYVRNWSFWLDLYILARTLKVVLRLEGAY